MRDDGLRHVDALPSCSGQAAAEVDIFEIHEERIVETIDGVKCLSPY